jgi:hypothetical protein
MTVSQVDLSAWCHPSARKAPQKVVQPNLLSVVESESYFWKVLTACEHLGI